MITVNVNDLLIMAQLLTADGIKLVNIREIEADGELPKALHFEGHNLDGISTTDYEEIEEVVVPK